MRVKVRHSDDDATQIIEYDLDHIEITGPVVIETTNYGTLLIRPTQEENR